MTAPVRSGRRPDLVVAVTDALGRPVRQPGLTRWLRVAAPPGTRGTLTIALVSDARMRALNRRFRGMDRVTDVLSFPMGPAPADHSGGRVGDAQLGDVVIALGRAERQARAMGHARLTELKVLALHGVLHLLGHDHETDDGAMSRAERRCLRRGGLAHGLLGRSDVVPVVSPPRRTGRGARRGT